MRVKLYQLNENRVWEDKGTGHVTCAHSGRHNGMSLLVRSETNGSQLLDSRIEVDTVYEIQQETLIVWSEGETTDLALSFYEKSGCEEVWEKIRQIQRFRSSMALVPLKKSLKVDLSQPLRRWIRSYCGVIEPEDANAIAEMNALRTSALPDSLAIRESSLSILSRYVDQLSAMNAKSLFILSRQVDVPFHWTNAFYFGKYADTTYLSTANAGYERASMLFNIAALQSRIAAGRPPNSGSELEVCSKLLQESAGIFKYLKENVELMVVGQELTSDLKPDVLGALSALMLAQGQEVFYLKAAKDNTRPAIVAKIAQQASEFYGDAYTQMNAQSAKKVLRKTGWLPKVAGKSAGFEAIAHYQQSLTHLEAKEYGKQVAYLQRAMDLFSVNGTSVELFADEFPRIKTAYQTAKRDNDFIHHKCVPDTKSLPEIEKAPLAKIPHLLPLLSEPGNFTDIFAYLLPAALNHAAARFEYRRRQAIQSETEKLRQAHALLLEQMADELTRAILLDSLNLPPVPVEIGVEVGSYSWGLLEAVARLRRLLRQVEMLKCDRDAIEAMLKKQANNGSDPKASFLRALTELGDAAEEEIAKEHLEKSLAGIRLCVTASVEAQQHLRHEIELAHAEFVREGGIRILDQLPEKDCLFRWERLALASEQPNLCPVNDMTDDDLHCIFQHLGPYDRLLVSEACKRWYELSRMPWRDISSLDITHIPGPNVGAVLKHCPNLKAIFALGKAFSRNELSSFARVSLASLRLWRCTSGVFTDYADDPEYADDSTDEEQQWWRYDLLPFVFADSLSIDSLEELILNDFCMPTTDYWVVDHYDLRRGGSKGKPIWFHFGVKAEILSASLKRLLLAGIHVRTVTGDPHDRAPALSFDSFFALGRLRNLTCLVLLSSAPDDLVTTEAFVGELRTLQNLRELYLGSLLVHVWLPIETVVMSLPRLEVLFLNNVSFDPEDAVERDDIDLVPLVTEHPALRILCVTGWHPHEHVIPVRGLYPNGFAAPPVPLLHVFLGKEAAENTVFTKSPEDALKVYPLTEPLPTFLEKEEIAPICDGVWIAEQIKLDAKYQTSSLYDPHADNDVSIRIVDPN